MKNLFKAAFKIFLGIFLAILVSGNMWGQNILTVHDGTATNSYVPIYGFYTDAYLKCEFVYPASELSVMTDGIISKITFYTYSPAESSWGDANFQVFLKEVNNATISAFSGTDGAIIVYEGALDGTGSTMEISFTRPYTYNGGNLLIGIYNTVEGSYKAISWYGENCYWCICSVV